MHKNRWAAVALLASAAVVAAGCTNKQGETEAPVSISVSLQDQAGLTNLNPARTITIPTMVLQSRLKNPNDTNPAGFANVQLSYYTVTYRRADGGPRVPPVQTFAAGHEIDTPGTDTLTDFPVLSQTASQGTPFDQLDPINGGIDRETNSNEIRMFYDVVFYGQTISGQRVKSETATGVRIFIFQ
jgi:hypothetical protein